VPIACAPGEEEEEEGSSAESLQIGLYDEEQLLAHPDEAFQLLGELGPAFLRVNLRWDLIAGSEPADPSDDRDPAYNWTAYDDVSRRASASKMELLLHIFGTPAWANAGAGINVPPTDAAALEAFAYAAAKHFPDVRRWAAWNEPNLSLFLAPSWERLGEELVPIAAEAYAGICNAVFSGVHRAGDEGGTEKKVACGVTSPRGRGGEAIAPLRFLRELKEAGARFDAYAHHPYARRPDISPSTPPPDRFTVSLGNIDDLFSELDRLYGSSMPLWITEYGYETNPPDPEIGVSWETQAEWMREAYELAAENPRIELFTWFLLKDEPDRNGEEPGFAGWQSGLITESGERKPAFDTFRELAGG
jgi:hypothetical protein